MWIPTFRTNSLLPASTLKIEAVYFSEISRLHGITVQEPEIRVVVVGKPLEYYIDDKW
jgi:hypothetical protein